MKRILTKNYNNSYFQQDETVTYTVDIQPQYVDVNINVEFLVPVTTLVDGEVQQEETYQSKTLLNARVTMESIRGAKRLKSNTLLALFPKRMDFQNFDVKTETVSTDFINVSQVTKDQRTEKLFSGKLSYMLDNSCSFFIFVRDVNGSFTDNDIIIVGAGLSEAFTLNSNEQFEEIDNFSHLTLLDEIAIQKDNSYTDNDYFKYTISTENYVDAVYLEQVIGIIDRFKVELDNGVGHFRVLKSSIENDVFKARAGFYSYPGLVDIS